MKFVGIIAEFNPFSNGHNHLIAETKKMFPEHKIAVVMSGDFVQRGEPAILDKYKRANHAICSGADVVLELPTVFATSSAEDFAYGAVKTLSQINGLTNIVFGSECGNLEELYGALSSIQKASEESFKLNLKSGKSFASSAIDASRNKILEKPNNMLGVMYLKAIKNLGLDILPTTIKRKDNYNSLNIDKLSSSSAIRNILCSNGDISAALSSTPSFSHPDLTKRNIINFDIYHALLSHKILTSTPKEISKIYGIAEGIEYKIIEENINCLNFEMLISALSSKRYPQNKIKRILFHILLDLKSDVFKEIKTIAPYLKVLSINEENKKNILRALSFSKAPLITKKKDITKLNSIQLYCYNFDVLASNIYSIITSVPKNSDYTHKI